MVRDFNTEIGGDCRGLSGIVVAVVVWLMGYCC